MFIGWPHLALTTILTTIKDFLNSSYLEIGQQKAAHRAGFQHGERLYDCFDSFSSVLRRARADTPPNSSDFLPVFHANYCKKSQISLKRFSHDDRIITMPFIEESAQNQCGQAASMGIPVGCVRITKIKAALHPIGFMQDCLRKCEESIFI